MRWKTQSRRTRAGERTGSSRKRLGTFSLMLVLTAFVLLGVTQSGLGFAASASTATISADKADYNPGSTVTLTGAGWAPSEAVHITVDDSAGQAWSYATDATADANGGFTNQFVLPTFFVAAYTVTATGPTSGTATTGFTDAVGSNLDQCQNENLSFLSDPCGTTPANANPAWANGDINGNNSQYREGDGIPYRESITGLTNGTWTVVLDYDFTKGGVPAVDRLTRFNLTQASNPCLSTNDLTCNVAAPSFTFPMPSEVASPDSTHPALPGSGDLHTWNGFSSVLLSAKTNPNQMTGWSTCTTTTFVSAGANNTGTQSTSFTDGKVQQNGSSTGDSDRQFGFKVTLAGCPANGGTVMLGWSGHIASHLDWGTPPGGAASISGAPFHMRVEGVDQSLGTSGGNQDRSVQLGAIVQTLEVKKVLSPVGSGTFDLQIDGTTKAAGVGNGGDTGPIAVTAANHSVGELGAGGTSLSNFSSSISCVNGSGTVVASGTGSSLASVPVSTGDSVVCTITNTQVLSHLTLVKQVTNDNGGTAAATAWTLAASGPTPLSGTTPVSSDVTAGTYSLSESGGPSGYSASAWVCVGGSQSGSSVTLTPGQSATCTITNDDIPPALHLRKVVVNDNGGTAANTAWTLHAGSLSGSTPVDSGPTFQAGTYALSEDGGPSGYSASAWVCVGGSQSGSSITVGIGQSATCTITNDDIAPSLHLRKVVVNDNGGTALNTAWTLHAGSLSGSTPVDSGPTFQAGTYALSEDGGPSGYSASAWSCVGGSQSGASITVGIGQSATCTITNDDIAPSLHLRKVVVNDNGGTALNTAWTLHAGSLSGSTPVDSGPTFSAGTYALSEDGGPAGYAASAWSCVGGSQTGSSITVGVGESATCTITNDDIGPSLHLRKVVVNDNGGTAANTAWTLHAGSLSGSTPVDSGPTFAAGTYALSEDGGPSGYSASAWSCVGGSQTGSSITLGLGDSATCTITNDDIAPALHLRKVVVNDNGGTAATTAWTLHAGSLSGSTPVDSGPTFQAGTYALSEDGGPSGYAASAWSCVGGSQTGSSIAIGIGETATCTITNDDIAPVLHLRKVVVNDNGGTALATAWTLHAGSLSGSTPVDSGPTFSAGTYALSETGGPSNYTASAWVCVGGSQTASSIALGVGETATCTITNDDNPGTIVIVKDAKPQSGTFTFGTTGSTAGPGTSWPASFNLSGNTSGGANTQSFTVDAGTYTATESSPLGWILTGIGGSTDPNTPYNCVVTGGGGSTGVGDLNTQAVTIAIKSGDTVTCTFENTGSGTTRTQGFWATHPQLANIAWFGGTAFGHTFAGVAAVSGIGDAILCGRPIDTLGKLMGGFWSGVSKTSTGAKRSALDQLRMQLLQQLLAAELNASAFGAAPSVGTIAAWEAAYCGTNQNAIKTAQQQAADFNTSGDSGTFTPGTSADSKSARSVANLAFWDTLP